MKNILLFYSLLFGSACVWAQSAREQIHENIKLSASNYVAYIDPTESLTPSPKGYEPFYISHYGRHGSRWLINDYQYSDALYELRQADKFGKLTEVGKDVLNKLEIVYKTSDKRRGDLTTVGERQHHGIGKRLTKHFPEVFSGDAYVDARSTVVIRCILSMTAECEELAAFNPNIRIHNDVSEAFQYYLNNDRSEEIRKATAVASDINQEYRMKLVHPERLSQLIFNDKEYVNNNVDAATFMRRLFDIASNMQSHDMDIDFYNLFTEDECYDLWRIKNIDWYVRYASAPASKGLAPYAQDNLLNNIITTADTIINTKGHGATLRFGHEVCLLPLACLLELGECAYQTDDLDNLDQHWANFRIYPMASNIQLVFYRPVKGKGDILVKALLNEREVSMPVKTSTYPYYKWTDLRDYYVKKLNKN